MHRLDPNFGTYTIYMLLWMILLYSNPKSFVNFLLPNRGFGEGWGGVKNLRLLQELLYLQFYLRDVRFHDLRATSICRVLFGTAYRYR